MKQQNTHNNLTDALKGALSNPKEFSSYEENFSIAASIDMTTQMQFGALGSAASYFNKHLFGNSLSSVIFTHNRHARCKGYFLPDAYSYAAEKGIPEININPNILQLPNIEVMATLVHELSHFFEQLYGKPGCDGYHNKEFARIMFAIGLMCSDTGKPGGSPTGKRVSHYVIEGGLFEQVFNRMPEKYFLPFKSLPASHPPAKPKYDKNKRTFECESCKKTRVWGKPNTNVLCGYCNIQLTDITDYL